MSRPRMTVVKICRKRVPIVRIRAGRRFEENFLHISRQISPVLEYGTAKKLFGFSHDPLSE
jgi:hypothetical protein